MKNIEIRWVFASAMLAVVLATLGCKGSRGTPLPLLGLRTNLDGQSAEIASDPAKIDFDAAEDELSKVALASYVSQDKNANQAQWLKSYDDAVELSRQTGKPILADFTGSNWCGACIKLKKEVFDTPQFKSWAANNVVLLELDFPRPNLQADWIKQQNNQLSERYEIKGYPTVKILNADGSVIGSQGYMKGGPKRWIAVASNHINANQALRKAKLVDVADLKNHQ